MRRSAQPDRNDVYLAGEFYRRRLDREQLLPGIVDKAVPATRLGTAGRRLADDELVVEANVDRCDVLEIGSPLPGDADLWIEVNRATEVRPSTGQAARMFWMNLPNWRHDPYVEANYPPDKLEWLATELDGLTGFAETGRIVWHIRQISQRQKEKS